MHVPLYNFSALDKFGHFVAHVGCVWMGAEPKTSHLSLYPCATMVEVWLPVTKLSVPERTFRRLSLSLSDIARPRRRSSSHSPNTSRISCGSEPSPCERPSVERKRLRLLKSKSIIISRPRVQTCTRWSTFPSRAGLQEMLNYDDTPCTLC